MNKLTALFLLSLVVTLSFGQHQASSQWEKFILKTVASGKLAEVSDMSEKYFLVSVNSESKAVLYSNENIKIARKLDENHFIIYFKKAASAARINTLFKEFYPTNDLWKLSPSLADFSPQQESSEKQYVVKVRNLKNFNEKLLNNWQTKIIQEHKATNTVILKASSDVVKKHILPSTEVIYISLFSGSPQEESLVLDLNLNVNKINLVQHLKPELNGQGLSLSIKEQAFDESDIDLKGRVLTSDIKSESTSRHATEMATIAAGGGNTSPNSQGPAWGSMLSSSSFENLFPDDDAYFETSVITIQNHSYGTTIENFYGALAEAYDVNTNTNPELLHVFSVGNNGIGIDTTGTYKDVEGFANMTGNFKMAKNILTVGAVDTLNTPDPYVSKGPAYDGRVKPEVAAYSISGSSSSASLVSGLSILLQQAYKEQNNGLLPDATLLKAILINTADDVGPEGVDFLTGFGNVNAWKALKAVDSAYYFSGTIDSGESQTFTISLPSNAKNLKVALAWNDPAASANAGTALTNDLDLIVQHPGTATSWLPWVLNSYPHKDSLTQLPERKKDHLNNIEQVTAFNVASGDYEIKIDAFDVPAGPQKFFVTYQWDRQDTFTWTSPTGSDNMPYNGKRGSIFRWESTYGDVEGQLEYSINNGVNWQLIGSNIDLSKGYFSWTAPDIYAVALARMTIGGKSYTSDPFTISKSLKPSVGFNCEDSVMFSWGQINNAESYVLYTMGEKYLTPVLETTDTAVVFDKEEFPHVLYAVAPKLTGDKLAFRSLTYNYLFQGVDCYLSTFFAIENQEDGLVDLTLTVGTTYGISSIIFERKNNNGYETIQTINNPTGTIITSADTQPLQGLNTYRARITFGNGAEIISEPSMVYFLTDLPVLIFPNPLEDNEDLNVFTKDFAGKPAFIQLMNTNGKVVLKYQLLAERESIPLSHLAPGLYLYSVISEGINHSGKIIIR